MSRCRSVLLRRTLTARPRAGTNFRLDLNGYHYRKRYQVEGINISAARRQSFKTQAAAKAAIVKQIKATQAENAS